MSLRKCSYKPCSKRSKKEGMIINGLLAFCKDEARTCQVAYAMEAGKKLRDSQQRAERKAVKTRRKNFYANDLSHQKALTQTVCNKLVSLLDKGRHCISCSRPLRGGRFQNVSHFKSVGANSFLRYDPKNLHLACIVCNLHQSGAIEGYTKGLFERYGQEIIDFLESAPRVKAWTCAELIELRALYAAEIRLLEKGLPASRDWRAL